MSHSYFQSFLFPLSICSVFLLVLGCSGPRPILYPNNHLQQVGPDQAERDVEECQKLAEDYVPEHEASTVAGNTAVGAGAGSAVGAVSGALRGGVGIGAAIGAATGATVGLIRGLFQASQPTPAHKAFVNRCLAERGYDSIGWD
ncbi:glycine zipper family protein [uncultured Nitrospira sp.]|uniref:glycine zipper family protein n=1 Tax=uncultured Nitrospira sp. TaxID=157176 RepID=UPI003140278C